MGLLDPVAPPYDPLDWEQRPFAEQSRMACRSWAVQGYGTPPAIYLVYALKVAAYVAGWLYFCGRTPGMGDARTLFSGAAGVAGAVDGWWLAPIAFQKAILWSMLFEVLGLGCGSGPLTGRYMPPIGGLLYFLRPGTTKLPLFPGVTRLSGTRRTHLDALLYAAALISLLRALLSPSIGPAHLIPVAMLIAVLGLLDKTIFLAARAEHYWTTVLVFLLAPDWIPGAKAVQAALWFWAGFSKVNHHFPSVVCVMTSNSPLLRFEWLRKRMYRDYPRDLSPSRLAVIAHGGTLLEFAVPILLLVGDGGTLTIVGLALMLLLHGYITSNVPMGVPIEWNVMMVYGAFFLFWKNAHASVLSIPLPVAAFLAVMIVVIPLLGNVYPSRISFLMAMRYYAGNWACSVWLFKGQSHRKLEWLTKSSPWIHDQLALLYPRSTAVAMLSKVMAFRLMHLHGRALPALLPRAIGTDEDYQWIDGEVIAGLALGWNFGDGHLHDERLLRAIQEQCGFEEGELRCIFVESQPLGRATMDYRIADAKTGLMDEGRVRVAELLLQEPWRESPI